MLTTDRDSAPRRSPDIRRTVRVAFLAALFWTGLGLFFTTQLLFAGLPLGLALAFSMPRWYSWGLLAPLVFWADRKLGATRTLSSRVMLHVPLGIAWTTVAILLRLATRPLRGAPPVDVAAFFLERFYWDLLIYAVIAGVSISRDYAAQLHDRERQAHETALRTADLERRLVESRLQALTAQLRPHFLFNALNTVSAFTERDPRMARRLVEQLGNLLRTSLTHADRPIVTLGDELTFLDDYLAIELARFEERLVVSVHADDDVLDLPVPGFLLQPLVENAIRHGMAPTLARVTIEVTARRDGAVLNLRVRDDGAGLPPGWDFERDAHVGLRNVASRLEHLYGRAGVLRVLSRPTGGVDVVVQIPIAEPSARASGLVAAAR